jgi:uncharacterized metal-binding protein
MGKELYPMCAKCGKRICDPFNKIGTEPPPIEEAPSFCPMRLKPEILEKAMAEYARDEIKELARLASLQEAECYEWVPTGVGDRLGIRTKIPRVEETIQFAQKMGYHKLGIAFCIGLESEARGLDRILENRGFQVVSICCKTGRVDKERIGLKREEMIGGPKGYLYYESMCSPIAQAEILNSEKVDLAILLGLCVGHDTLFFRYCKVPMTVLVVKDRVFGHNPAAAIYLSSAPYYGRLMTKSAERRSGS